MKRVWFLVIVAICPLIGQAQNAPSRSEAGARQPAFPPAVPPPSMVGAYGGGWGVNSGGTAAGSALTGMSNVISAQGNYNLATSAAAINLTQAQSNEIANRQQATDTYFNMRATNKAARAAEAGPRVTMEQVAKIAHEAVPNALNASQMDPVTGRLNWPGPLQEEGFASERATLDQIVAKQTNYGGLSYADQTKARETVNSMFRELKAMIKSIPPPDYVACRTFLNSVLFSATRTALQ